MPTPEVVPPVRTAEVAPPAAGDPPAPAPAVPAPAAEAVPEVHGGPDRQEPALGPNDVPSEGGRVKLVLDDGTLATPALDEELTERLRYIVDNIVTPPEQPST